MRSPRDVVHQRDTAVRERLCHAQDRRGSALAAGLVPGQVFASLRCKVPRITDGRWHSLGARPLSREPNEGEVCRMVRKSLLLAGAALMICGSAPPVFAQPGGIELAQAAPEKKDEGTPEPGRRPPPQQRPAP